MTNGNSLQKLIFINRAANEIMQAYGLLEDGWRFEISNTKQSVGRCRHAPDRIIEYSKWYLDETDEQILDTILHEIAHALVGPGHGHDDMWKQMCLMVGAKPDRLVEDVQSTIKYNYVLKCVNPDCTKPAKIYRHRLKEAASRYYCINCGTYLKAFRLKYTQ